MFSQKEKIKIANEVEKLLLKLKHPEMPTERIRFKLHIKGKEDWSFADIEPNWLFNEGKIMGVNPFNEKARELLK